MLDSGTARPFGSIHGKLPNLHLTNQHQMKAEITSIKSTGHKWCIDNTFKWNGGFCGSLWSICHNSSPDFSAILAHVEMFTAHSTVRLGINAVG